MVLYQLLLLHVALRINHSIIAWKQKYPSPRSQLNIRKKNTAYFIFQKTGGNGHKYGSFVFLKNC